MVYSLSRKGQFRTCYRHSVSVKPVLDLRRLSDEVAERESSQGSAGVVGEEMTRMEGMAGLHAQAIVSLTCRSNSREGSPRPRVEAPHDSPASRDLSTSTNSARCILIPALAKRCQVRFLHFGPS